MTIHIYEIFVSTTDPLIFVCLYLLSYHSRLIFVQIFVFALMEEVLK